MISEKRKQIYNIYNNGIGPFSGKCVRVGSILYGLLLITQSLILITGIITVNLPSNKELKQEIFGGFNVNTNSLNLYTNQKRSSETNTTIIVIVKNDTVSDADNFYCKDTVENPEKHHRQRQLTIFLLALFLGNIGVARCVAGFTCCGLVQIFTCGGCFCWWLIDWILVLTASWVRDSDGYCFINNM